MRKPPSFFRSSTLYFVLAICFAFCVSATFVVSSSIADDDKSQQTTRAKNLRKIGDYRRALKAFMKNSKRAGQPEIQRAAIYNLCQIHFYIVNDPRFADSQQLQGMRVVAANRLKAYSRQVRNEHLRDERNKSAKDTTEPVDQSQPALSDSEYDYGTDEAAYQTIAANGTFSGGPQQLFGYLGGNSAPPWDHGDELVRLIENTINPDFWQRNGGEGRIHYFRPLRVLVVGASSQVHDDTLELLRKLRYANQ